MQDEGSSDTDVAPLKDSIVSLLRELVGQHNMLVGLDTKLAELDKMLLGPLAPGDLIGGSELRKLMEHPTTSWVITKNATDALIEIIGQAPIAPDSNSRSSRRASESGKNLLRKVIEALYRHKKVIGVAAVAIPSGLYALGKWALANEEILVAYFHTSPGMSNIVQSIMAWLHTLPLA
jgi:hypothetical protein